MTPPNHQRPAGRGPTASGSAPTEGVPLPVPTDPPFEERLIRFLKRATVIGVLGSVLIHLAMWQTASYLRVEHDARAGSGHAASVVDFAVMTDVELAMLSEETLALESPVLPDVALPEVATIDLFQISPDIDLSGEIRDLADAELLTGAGDLGGRGIGEGGAGGGAGFFGAEATGSRFVYIVDTSGSMGVGGRIERLREELLKSIDALYEHSHFVIVQFASDAQPLSGEMRWTQATERMKRSTRTEITGIRASGGTNPSPAFHLAFTLRPRPDAIFFMTDGEFPEQVAGEIARLNREHRVPIHCICFVTREAEPHMRRIARESGGSYTFVSGGGP